MSLKNNFVALVYFKKVSMSIFTMKMMGEDRVVESGELRGDDTALNYSRPSSSSLSRSGSA